MKVAFPSITRIYSATERHQWKTTPFNSSKALANAEFLRPTAYASLFTVTETLTVPGKGIVVLLPQLKPIGEEKFRVGDLLRLRRPDGDEDLVPIGGLEFLKPVRGNCQLVVTLAGKSREDVTVGTEVCSVDKPAGPLLR